MGYFKLEEGIELARLLVMKEIYRSSDWGKVGHFAERLKAEGIEIFIRNDNLSGTEIPIPDFYPAICVVNEKDEESALKFLHIFFEEEKRPLGPDWHCEKCNEAVPDSMQECWSCQTARPPAVAGE